MSARWAPLQARLAGGAERAVRTTSAAATAVRRRRAVGNAAACAAVVERPRGELPVDARRSRKGFATRTCAVDSSGTRRRRRVGVRRRAQSGRGGRCSQRRSRGCRKRAARSRCSPECATRTSRAYRAVREAGRCLVRDSGRRRARRERLRASRPLLALGGGALERGRARRRGRHALRRAPRRARRRVSVFGSFSRWAPHGCAWAILRSLANEVMRPARWTRA